MTSEGRAVNRDVPVEISLVLFRAAGVKMGVDAAQIEEIVDSEEAEKSGICSLHPAGLFGEDSLSSASCPKTLLHKGESGTFGLGIDELCEIKTVRVDSLRPLPAIIASLAGPRNFWGATAMGEEIVLLVDLRGLEGRRSKEVKNSA